MQRIHQEVHTEAPKMARLEMASLSIQKNRPEYWLKKRRKSCRTDLQDACLTEAT